MTHSAGYSIPKTNDLPLIPPPAISYHIHVVFDLDDPTSLPAAIALRDASRERFKEILGPDCDGRYDNGHLCLIFDHPIDTVLVGGPFFSGEWSMFVPVSHVNAVQFWFT